MPFIQAIIILLEPKPVNSSNKMDKHMPISNMNIDTKVMNKVSACRFIHVKKVRSN